LRIFSALYDRVLRWAGHAHAERYLAALSFAESSFFPIPPDVMLAPMTLAKPQRGWRFAFLATVFSVIGGAAGYAIGWWGLESIEPLLMRWGYWEAYLQANAWFDRWGVLAVFVAGFSPIPYKIFTISAGALHMLLPAFMLASFVGRGARFFLVAALLRWGGAPMEARLRASIDAIGWSCVVLAVVIVLLIRLG
jgi:membrane protein YqaA with SNARE-associated domain